MMITLLLWLLMLLFIVVVVVVVVDDDDDDDDDDVDVALTTNQTAGNFLACSLTLVSYSFRSCLQHYNNKKNDDSELIVVVCVSLSGGVRVRAVQKVLDAQQNLTHKNHDEDPCAVPA